MVGPVRFELTTSRPPDERANQAALWPDMVEFSEFLVSTTIGEIYYNGVYVQIFNQAIPELIFSNFP